MSFKFQVQVSSLVFETEGGSADSRTAALDFIVRSPRMKGILLRPEEP